MEYVRKVPIPDRDNLILFVDVTVEVIREQVLCFPPKNAHLNLFLVWTGVPL